MKRIKLIFVIVWLAFQANAQDNHFTLFRLAPLMLNPAQTAAAKGELRAGALYRNQWRSVDKPFSTINGYADKKFFVAGLDLGVGLSISNDRSGPGGLNVVKIYPSVSVKKHFGKHAAIVGVQPGLVHKKIKNATYPNQYDHTTATYTTALPSGESSDNLSKAYFDLNVGVGYMLTGSKYEFEIGQAIHHVNMPNESIASNQKNNLPMRFTTHTSYKHWVTQKVYIMPAILFMFHNKATELAINAHAGYRLFYEEDLQITLRLGAAYRNNIQNAVEDNFFGNSDATSVLAGVSWNKIDVDFAYDINVSDLSEASKNAGAFEIAVTYRDVFERKNDIITVPCRRY